MSAWRPAHSPKLDGPTEAELLAGVMYQRHLRRLAAVYADQFLPVDPLPYAERVLSNTRLFHLRAKARVFLAGRAERILERKKAARRAHLRVIRGGAS